MNKKYSKTLIHWLKNKRINIKDNLDLFSSDKLDSFSFIELLVYIEKKNKIVLDHQKIFEKKKLTVLQLSSIIQKSENLQNKKKKT
ncbi:hypothetical protein [Candidatus Pelagibacter sp. HIMB1542]|uniref:hypothetical protein n=1 Tax=Candidatus Pelagibacter sp. HIMB1542 TaxID=3413346 RepID=UPI003F86424B